ncbi:MAG: hypothetical protein ACI4DT_04365 [Chordicoccus sp.]
MHVCICEKENFIKERPRGENAQPLFTYYRKKVRRAKIRIGQEADLGKEDRSFCKETLCRENLSKRKKFRRGSIFCKADLVRDPHQGDRESACFSHNGEETCFLFGRGDS